MRIYLDNNATTRVDPRVVLAMQPCWMEIYGNPSSSHTFGVDAKAMLAKARRKVQALLGSASPDEIVFTSGGSESNTLAIRGALEAHADRPEVVISAVEHAAVKKLCAALAKRGIVVHEIPVDRTGRLDLAAYQRVLSERVALVSIMWANNETGTLFPVAELAARAKEAGALFHTDAVQAVGRLPISLARTSIDLLSLSGHKLHAPKGVGALYVRRGTKLATQTIGGAQERRRRAGTENVPGIVGLGTACALAAAGLDDNTAQIKALRELLESELLARVPDARVLGDLQGRVANTSCIAFAQVDAEALVNRLDRNGIAVGSGAACGTGAVDPSHVLQAMAVPATHIHGAVRFSLSRETTAAEIARTVDVVPALIAELRGSAMAA